MKIKNRSLGRLVFCGKFRKRVAVGADRVEVGDSSFNKRAVGQTLEHMPFHRPNLNQHRATMGRDSGLDPFTTWFLGNALDCAVQQNGLLWVFRRVASFVKMVSDLLTIQSHADGELMSIKELNLEGALTLLVAGIC